MLCYHNGRNNFIFLLPILWPRDPDSLCGYPESWSSEPMPEHWASEELNAGTSVADLDPGFFLPPRSGICIRHGGKKPDPGWTSRILLTFWVKYTVLKFFMQIRIRDTKSFRPWIHGSGTFIHGSGINIPDPQHWLEQVKQVVPGTVCTCVRVEEWGLGGCLEGWG